MRSQKPPLPPHPSEAGPPAGHSVAVRELCEFAAKSGDLDLRFTPSPTSQQGIAGHRTVAARRAEGYRTEVALQGQFAELTVRGRADGYDPGRGLLEEVKTFRGVLERMPANHRALHWAQAKVYGWLLCAQQGLTELTVSLVYFEIRTQQETALTLHCSAAELQAFFDALAGRFLRWAQAQLAHRQRRDAALRALKFPHAGFRAGQRPLAEAVFTAARRGRCLLAQAPTGLGKTIATLFPLLKACPDQSLDKLFFLSAKGSGRALAMAAVETLRGAGTTGAGATPLPLRVIELIARDTACVHPDKACHGDSCPLARGFYDRLPAAREAALASPQLHASGLREIAAAHAVCPYYLTQELVRWSDVVVGDVNYFFDGSALLHGLAQLNEWRVAVLVDEAHNLIDRARAMYSAELDEAALQGLSAQAPAALRPVLGRVRRAWHALASAQTEAYGVRQGLPVGLIAALQDASSAITDLRAETPQVADDALLRFAFDAAHFVRLAESFGAHSLFDVSRVGAGLAQSRLCIRNVVPAPFLKPRFASTRTTVLFSATLTPDRFYLDMLGMPEDTAWIDVESPFDASRLHVQVASNVSTRLPVRARSLAPIARLMADQYAARPGNYLAFFSSFDYLAQAAAQLAAQHPEIPSWRQARRMDDAERAAFLARFATDGRGIAFAVLGGSFAEGIDLPGTRLIGAFIATLGLPQFNPVNEQMRQRIDATFGTGYDYTYLFPGLRKVVQAAGRVIRTEADRGTVLLIDDRFTRPEVRRLLPVHWGLA